MIFVQMLNMMTSTMQRFIEVFTDPELTPYLELSVHYEDGAILTKPSLNKIKHHYVSILNKVSSFSLLIF